ncbi:MAG: SH3 domain-containing protein, partial [Cyanobacteria bacterium J06649_11]
MNIPLYKLLNQLLVLLIISVCAGCSGDQLDREKAQNLVIEFYNYPNVSTAAVGLDLLNASRLKPMINAGLIAYERRNFMPGYRVTSKGKEYSKEVIDSESGGRKRVFAACINRFSEVTGISFLNEQETEAKIEFDVHTTNITPVGQCLNLRENGVSSYVIARKYDDGWRITSEKGAVFGAEDFPFIKEFPSESPSINTSQSTPSSDNSTLYSSSVQGLRIRLEPNEDAEVISGIAQGETVLDLGVESGSFTATLRGQTITAPWTKIEKTNGLQGWVFKGGLELIAKDSPKYRSFFKDQELQKKFLGTWIDKNGSYQEEIVQIDAASDGFKVSMVQVGNSPYNFEIQRATFESG